MKHVPNLTLMTILFAQLTTLQAAEPNPPEGFRAIFNGKDLTGWHGLNPHGIVIIHGGGWTAGGMSAWSRPGDGSIFEARAP